MSPASGLRPGVCHDTLSPQSSLSVFKSPLLNGVREFVGRCPRELAETNREHGRPQRVLERLPGSEIGRKRERPDQLGRADRLFHPSIGLIRREGRIHMPIAW
jgi:hypothetical protein